MKISEVHDFKTRKRVFTLQCLKCGYTQEVEEVCNASKMVKEIIERSACPKCKDFKQGDITDIVSDDENI